MAPFGSTYTDSPVLAMPPQPAHQGPLGGPVFPHQSMSFSHSSSWSQTPIQNSCSVAGRKRSRDEAAVNLDPPEKIVEPPIIKESEEDWVYGPGMTLIKRSTGYVPDATSQSGTWVEEKAAEKATQRAEAALIAQEQLSQERPSLRSHKSQRLEMITTHSPTDAFQSNRSSPIHDAVNPMTASSDSIAQPVVDDFTVHLGIGWSRISDSEHIQAAARGWARYIENHFPITNPKIRLESRGLQSYLVEANEGFFLFAENLRHGRLVSRDVERVLQNLKISPPTFDGLETMDAAESPKAVESAPESAPTTAPTTTIDMDMN
ncbi:hypothetical protein QBC33DRAFT_455104 [Phialemonium atrogriseum]|uniref:Uncharacterized protein n=1 Tax=Phialemonium atrogriseum TaxID=1093897 RepID=A0AAJ0FFJ2_9PEZI|nr:uncharacterized protein QBC33DRAFT_455104 [Phialemonium atrogriseum]KAK1765537.1 hypothetical protein QBC33DRAFT_455104 [Phialemonium atrogriseum]